MVLGSYLAACGYAAAGGGVHALDVDGQGDARGRLGNIGGLAGKRLSRAVGRVDGDGDAGLVGKGLHSFTFRLNVHFRWNSGCI